MLVALAYLYLSAGVHMFSTWRQARHDQAAVHAMQAEHRRLVRQHELLTKPAKPSKARRASWGWPGPASSQYVVSGLPATDTCERSPAAAASLGA